MSAARERILEARIAELERQLEEARRPAPRPAGFFQDDTREEVAPLRAPERGPVVSLTPDPDRGHVGTWALNLWRSKFTGKREPDDRGLVAFIQRNLRRKLK